MRRSAVMRACLVVFALTWTAPALRAQIAAMTFPDSSAPPIGPTRAAATAGVRWSPAPGDEARALGPARALTAKGTHKQGGSLIILGAAAFVAGLLIGDTAGAAIAIAGAGVGLYGLYIILP